MEILGLTISRTKALPPPQLSAVDSRSGWGSGGGWWPIIRESFTGAWQRNVEVRLDHVLTFSTVFACVTLIASDIAKLWLNLVQVDANGIWTPTENPAFSPILRKPNHYQTRIKFFEQWILSKLVHGNTYALKVRDQRNVVTRLYLLDPQRVKPLVAPDGAVYYQLSRDDLSGLDENSPVVPASEIIHDLMYPLYHPLVGVSPISACGLAATQGLHIQHNSAALFERKSLVSGILTAPGHISTEAAQRLQDWWAANFSGPDNAGKVAALGDGLKYEPMVMTASDAQLIEQLRWTGETVCSCFHVPPYMVGVGPAPTYNNIEALNTQYYSQCLQILIESLELCLDEGLELPKPYGVEFDLDALLRMDTATATTAAAAAIGAGFLKPNEARAKFSLKPVEGGDTPYLQQQNYSLAALNRRDQAMPPPPTGGFQQPALPAGEPADESDDEDRERTIADLLRKELALVA